MHDNQLTRGLYLDEKHLDLKLTARELECLFFLRRGRTAKQLARYKK
jgi:DNA-binding CsgD family transcriptional regulator